MLRWYIEYEGIKAPLYKVDLAAVREKVDPIRNQLGERLATLEAEERDLDIVFVFDECGASTGYPWLA